MPHSQYANTRGTRRAHQAGMTLLEVILGLSILALVTIGLNQLSDRWADDTKNTVAASQVRTFGEAVQSYIKDNYAAVQGVATATTPAIIDVPTLIAAQKLTPGYQNSNAYGQATCALVLQPTANRLQAMVITEGGKALGDPQLSIVAATVGGSGGGVYSTDTANIKGAVGGWQLAASTYDNLANNLGKTCSGAAGNVRVTAGHPMMALWFENGDVSSAFVARDAVPGRPELNAMSTPLVMNSVQTSGGACTSTGAIAQDGNGGLLTCQGGTWKTDDRCQYTTSDLNNLQTDGRCYNGYNLPNSPAGSDWVFVQVFRHVNQSAYYVTQQLTGMTGAAVGKNWTRTQQSGSQSGGWSVWYQTTDPGVSVGGAGSGTLNANNYVASTDLYASNAVHASNYVSTGDVYASGTVQAGTNIYSGGAVVAAGSVEGSYLYSSGSIVTNGSALNAGRGTYNYSDTDWAFLGYGAGGNPNAQPTNYIGSAYLNDVYLRSVGRWVSQMLTPKSYAIDWAPGICSGCVATMAPNWWVGGTALAVQGYSKNYGGGNCEGGTQYQLRDIYGNVVRGWSWLAGTNVGSGNDGGSGMWDLHPFTILMQNNAYYIDFLGTGCWGAQVDVQGLMLQ